MVYRLEFDQQQELINMPETGMGYQIIEASISRSYSKSKFIILNEQLAIPLDENINSEIKGIILEGINRVELSAQPIHLSNIKPYSESEFRAMVNDSNPGKSKGAVDNPKQKANGTEKLVRLSAFKEDRRIDLMNSAP